MTRAVDRAVAEPHHRFCVSAQHDLHTVADLQVLDRHLASLIADPHPSHKARHHPTDRNQQPSVTDVPNCSTSACAWDGSNSVRTCVEASNVRRDCRARYHCVTHEYIDVPGEVEALQGV